MESDKSRIAVSVLLVVALILASFMVAYGEKTTSSNRLIENELNQLTWLLRKKNLQIKALTAQLEGVKTTLDSANRNLASAKTDLEVATRKVQTSERTAGAK